MSQFIARSTLPAPAEAVYAWHLRPGALERLSPPWQDVRVVERSGRIDEPGSRVTLSIPAGPLRLRWIAEHDDAEPGRGFRDVQLRGPFASWEHRHRFIPEGTHRSVLEDAIEFRLPLHTYGGFLAESSVRRELERVFAFRHDTTAKDLAAHRRYADREPMKVVVTGSSGLIGSELVPFLETGGHEVVRLRRGAPKDGAPSWDPAEGKLDPEDLEGLEAVVHLAGESIASGRWTAKRKERIRRSRVDGTRLLSESLALLKRKPRVMVSASAIGYYGDRGNERLEPDTSAGEGFLADVCREWEEATTPARAAGIRVVNLRIGIVLSPRGGALRKMLTPFRLGAGGVVGSGAQTMSWISIDDVVGIVLHALMTDTLEGPVNAVAPLPVTNRELTRILGRVLRRPTIFPLPGFAARLAFGEMADELLLSSANVSAREVEQSGYEFRRPELEGALRYLLGR